MPRMTNWLAEARHRQGYTQASLAEHCGVSVRWIQAAEAGARSYGEPARRVAEALGADSIDTLWKYTILPGRPHRARPQGRRGARLSPRHAGDARRMSALETEGLPDLLAHLAVEGHAPERVRRAVAEEFPEIDPPSLRTVRRWLHDERVTSLAGDLRRERDRRALDRAAHTLDTADDLSVREAIAVKRAHPGRSDEDEITSHEFPNTESSAVAELWLLASDHAEEVVDRYPALAHTLGLRTPGDAVEEEEYA
jgi:transcriptional regulator with XRE-family HTH domain